jgi:predicted Zn-dependent protease
MTKEFRVEHNLETNEVVEIELTVEESEQLAIYRSQFEADKETETAQAAAKAAAQAKLAALGLTADDLEALGL